MLDLLNLPGVKPTDIRVEAGSLIVSTEVIEEAPPVCPACGKAMYRHGRRKHVFADTPMQMQPVKLEICLLYTSRCV